jgi:hypothetical protein
VVQHPARGAQLLADVGLDAAVYHGGLAKNERDAV